MMPDRMAETRRIPNSRMFRCSDYRNDVPKMIRRKSRCAVKQSGVGPALDAASLLVPQDPL
jgi:hypothetical protein